jgi:hypothetical protein
MLRPIVAFVVLLSTPALAQSYDRPDIIRGLCRPDGCDEFAIRTASPLIKGGGSVAALNLARPELRQKRAERGWR